MDVDEAATGALRDRLQSRITSELGEDVTVNGDVAHRLASNLHVSFLRVPNTAVIARVRTRLAVATGAACSSGVDAPSHVLRAMGLSHAAQEGAIRIGMGKWTTESEVEYAAAALVEAAKDAIAALGLGAKTGLD
jgi:cysteine desulfurase